MTDFAKKTAFFRLKAKLLIGGFRVRKTVFRFLCMLTALFCLAPSLTVGALAAENTENTEETAEPVRKAAAAVYEFASEYDTAMPSAESKPVYEGSLYDVLNFVNGDPYSCYGIVLSEDVKLDRNISISSRLETTGFILIDGDVVFDLNGHFFTQISGSGMSRQPLFAVPENSSLTLTDSSDGSKGYINGVQYAAAAYGGCIRLEGGTVMAQSNASIFPDECELPVSAVNGGKIYVSGGKIDYSGALGDGRTYSARSCAIYADSKSEIRISGGTVSGSIVCENGGGLQIEGGSFAEDLSEHIKPGFECVKNGKLFEIKKRVPQIKLFCGDAVFDGTAEEETGAERYVINAASSDGQRKSVRVELSETFRAADGFGLEKTPAVLIKTDAGAFEFDSDAVNSVMNGNRDGEIYFSVDAGRVSDENSRLIQTAVYEIKYELSDARGSRIGFSGGLRVRIPYVCKKDKQNVHIYSADGSGCVQKSMKYADNEISYTAGECETVVIADGKGVYIRGKALDLQGTISLVFYAAFDGVSPDNAKMLFWTSPQAEYTEKTAERTEKCSGKTAYGYKFEYKNISSKDMNKAVYARLMAVDDSGQTVYSDAPSEGYSVVSYAENMLRNEKLHPLLVRMLNYGAAAQEYFGSDDEPANSILPSGERATDYTRIYSSSSRTVAEDATEKCGAQIKGKTLSLEGDISVNYYIEPGNEPFDEAGMLFWNEHTYSSVPLHIMGTESYKTGYYEENGGYMVFTFPNIVSSAMNEQIYARVYTKKGDTYKYSDIDSYSVRDYAANQLSRNTDKALVKLLRTLMLYGDEAEKYFKGAIEE